MPQNPQCEIPPQSQPSAGHDPQTLDPCDWEEFRVQAHHMLDDIIEYIRTIRQRPVWQPIPKTVQQQFQAKVPHCPSSLANVHREFMDSILPFAAGNVHPGFMGWVHGGGTPVGMLAEMLAAGLNVNAGGRNQAPIEVERQIALWMRHIFGFPETAAGLFVTGTSMANFIAVVVARDVALGFDIRHQGVAAASQRLKAYASTEVHGCVRRALDLCGLGSDALRLIPADRDRHMDLSALETALRTDREAGFQPFLIVGTAGTVASGAIDDLNALAELAQREKVWFHVDGAYGALAMFAPELAPKLRGIERADSLAFDFHKWGQVPYDAGFVMLRDGALQLKAFAASHDYLRRETRGLAAGSPWPCDLGLDLSRGFRALKTWFTLKVHGTDAMGAAISRTCALARYLKQRVVNSPELELLAPVELNVVCFRYRANDSNRVNAEIVVKLQESGSVAPSTTILDGQLAIRAAIVNHRTSQDDIDRLLDQTLAYGRMLNVGTSSTYREAKPETQEALRRIDWERVLPVVEHQLSLNPPSVNLRLQRALVLSQLGRLKDARDEYIKVLEFEPRHLAALTNLGCLLMALGNRKAAGIVYNQAVLHHPNNPTSRVNLGHFLFEESEQIEAQGFPDQARRLKLEAGAHFEHALRVQADEPKAHEGLAHVWRSLGHPEKAEPHRRAAFRKRSILPAPCRGRGPHLPVLLFCSTTGGNVRILKFLDERIFQTYVVTPEFCDAGTRLPEHRLVVNGIGDAESSSEALAAARGLLTQTTAPVINSPAAVLRTSRSNNALRLAALPGVVAAKTILLTREQLSGSQSANVLADHGFQFPLLLRTPGSHTGLNFLQVEHPMSLPATLAKLPGQELIVMQFLDARGSDGKTRKYRVMMIDGQLYPLHCAISSHWKIHYFTAEMANNPEHRGEDQTFLENMPGVLGPRAMTALTHIQEMLGLDYAGIDFGLNANGDLLLFEANATMVVNPPDSGEQWKYRWPAFQQIQGAVHRMFIERANSSPRVLDGATHPSLTPMPTALGSPSQQAWL